MGSRSRRRTQGDWRTQNPDTKLLSNQFDASGWLLQSAAWRAGKGAPKWGNSLVSPGTRLEPPSNLAISAGERHGAKSAKNELLPGNQASAPETEKTRVFVAAENRLLRDVLARMLAQRSEMEVVGRGSLSPELVDDLQSTASDILLLSARGTLTDELCLIRAVRQRAPEVRILLLGMNGESTEFLHCARRAGVAGYLAGCLRGRGAQGRANGA